VNITIPQYKGSAYPLLVLLMLAVALIAVRPARVEWVGAVCVALTVPLCLWPLIQWWRGHDRSMPFIAAIGLFYLIWFVCQPFLTDFIWRDGPIRLYRDGMALPGNQLGTDAMVAMAGGIAMLMIVLMGTARWLNQRIRPVRFVAQPSVRLAVGLAVLALSGHFGGMLVSSRLGISSVEQLANPLAFVGFGIPVFLAGSNQIKRWWLIPLLGVLLPLKIVMGMESGNFIKVLMLPAFLVFLYLALNRRQAVVFLTIILVVGAVGYRPFRDFRDHVWFSKLSGKTLQPADYLASMKFGLNLTFSAPMQLEAAVVDAPRSPFLGSLRETAKRVNAAVLFAQVHALSPDPVPYWHGETLRPLLTSFIPRFLYAQKPEERLGNEFGRRYVFIPADNMNMAVNLPWLVEAYANFGLWGMLATMSVVGLTLAGLNALLNSLSGQPLNMVIGSSVLFPLINQESNISLTCGNIVLLIAVLYVMARSVEWGYKALFRPAPD
jgi:hypothetical protein